MYEERECGRLKRQIHLPSSKSKSARWGMVFGWRFRPLWRVMLLGSTIRQCSCANGVSGQGYSLKLIAQLTCV